MKTKILFSLFLSFYFYILFPQVPQGFTYQAIARDASDNPIANTSLPVTITIQSDSLGGTIFWEELHSAVTTNNFGLFTLIIGKGARQASSTVGSFSEINWSVTPKFIKTQIFYHSTLMNMGTTRLWSVPYSMVAQDISGPIDKLEVNGKTELTDEALFEVKNKKGQTVFAVYNDGVRVYVNDTLTKGTTKGGFAIGGFSTDKNNGKEYFRVTPDSTRIYIDNTSKGATKGGFAIGGFDQVKGTSQKYWVVNPDSIRAYIDTNPSKGTTKGGFAIGGFGTDKSGGQEYLRITSDSTRIYVNKNLTKGTTKGGFAIGGFDNTKSTNDEYLRVTSDSVKVSKSLLIPRLTTYERDHLSFIPGEALIIFNMSEGCMQIFKNSVWSNIWCFNCAPAFIIQPVDNTICSGNNVNFFVSATGTNLSYQWQQSTDNGINWNDISNGGSNPACSGTKGYSLTLSNVPVGYNGYKYRCFVVGPCLPNIISNASTLTINTSPEISDQPENKLVYAGSNITFNIIVSGSGNTYQWQESIDGGSTWNILTNGGTNPAYGGVNTANLVLSKVPLTYDNKKYRCVVSHFCPNSISESATLTVATSSPVTDIDGNTYNTVGIGSQLWIVENLKTTKYKDGTTIPLVPDGIEWSNLSSPGYCWYNNNEATYKNTFGALYNWYTVNTGKLCPTGWHVPTDDELTTLSNYLGGESVAGGLLKESGTTHWNNPNTGATNETGFTALPGGFRSDDGTYNYVGESDHVWSSTEKDANIAWSRQLHYLYSDLFINFVYKKWGLTVRCLKDN